MIRPTGVMFGGAMLVHQATRLAHNAIAATMTVNR